MTDLNMLESDLEAELRSSVRSLMQNECAHSELIEMYDGNRAIAHLLWTKMRDELGLAGILVSEERGGVGLTAREAAVIMEELGGAAAASPFLTSSIVAATVLQDFESSLLDQISSGERTVALAVPFSTSAMDTMPSLRQDEAGRLHGAVASVAGAIEADILLLPVGTSTGLALYAVAADQLQIKPKLSLDMTRQVADVIVDNAIGDLIARQVESKMRRALLVGAAMLASEQVGVARWCLDTTLEYLKDRRQFGRSLGSFQALKHRLADLYVAIESASAAARYAAIAISESTDDVDVAVAVAQSYCSDVAVLASEEAVQLHAGMGMTWEHPAHLYLKRAKADQIAFGNPGLYRQHLANLINLPFAAPSADGPACLSI